MTDKVNRLKEFVAYAQSLDGDEKGEAQVFCDRLFKAFGHAGYKEAGAQLEKRIRKAGSDTTSFADLVWPGRVLIEMKKRGAKLSAHYKQAFDYWIAAVPNRPRYVILCNFDEFWIYDFDKQIDEPVDEVSISELPSRYAALNFLFPDEPSPVFGNDRVAVTRDAADQLVAVFNSLIKRGEDRDRAQRFILQMLVALFAEDMDLLPNGLVANTITECLNGESCYDLFGSLFRQMNSKTPARGGRFKDVPYFNGGLFAVVDPCELNGSELVALGLAASRNWSKVNPAIFGTIFQHSMGAEARHALGAHFTSEADIQRVVLPTIVRPWQERIAGASTLADLVSARKDLATFRVLDPACGSGNFLYVAYREMVRLEIQIIKEIKDRFSLKAVRKHVHTVPTVSPTQFFGIDVNDFGVELAKVTLLLAKKLGIDEALSELEHEQAELGLYATEAIPLDNLDNNIVKADAVLTPWPVADAIIGNPPYQSKNKMQKEYGVSYVNEVRSAYAGVSGRADYCVYWFRKAHDSLAPGKRAGLVGTNTIRENYSREGGLDYIVDSGGTITEAVSSQVWSGDADVHVSIVNWVKGKAPGRKRLFKQLGDSIDSPWEVSELKVINSALSTTVDVKAAQPLRANKDGSYQGQTHGHEGFLLTRAEATKSIKQRPANAEVLFPYLIGNELLGMQQPQPKRYVIDFYPRTQLEATAYPELLKHIEDTVLPDRKAAAKEEKDSADEALKINPRARVNKHHRNFLDSWWNLSYPRGELLSRLSKLQRYIVCVRVTKRPIFEFISTSIRPSDSLMVFPYEDDYSFGILQSRAHWDWFVSRCSTLTARFRYTSNTVFDSFAWPQSPSKKQVAEVAKSAKELRLARHSLMNKHKMSLRDLYRTLEQPGKHELRPYHDQLDRAVRDCYGMSKSDNALAFLLDLNITLSAEAKVVGPGLPPGIAGGSFVSSDCVRAAPLEPKPLTVA